MITHTEEARAKMRVAHARRKVLGLYKPHTDERKKNISIATKGRIPHNKNVKTGLFKNCERCNLEFYVRARNDYERRRFCSYKCLANFNSERMAGAGSPLWKGGISPANKLMRMSREYREWRKAVFERDNYTCQDCGARSGKGKPVSLQADHIKPFALFPKLRTNVDNGRTLCVDCHRLTPTYGGRTAWL